MNPAPKIIAINLITANGQKNRITADHTERQVTQSKGLILFVTGILNICFSLVGTLATFTK